MGSMQPATSKSPGFPDWSGSVCHQSGVSVGLGSFVTHDLLFPFGRTAPVAQ